MINQNVAYLRSRSSARALTALSKESGIRSSSVALTGAFAVEKRARWIGLRHVAL